MLNKVKEINIERKGERKRERERSERVQIMVNKIMCRRKPHHYMYDDVCSGIKLVTAS